MKTNVFVSVPALMCFVFTCLVFIGCEKQDADTTKPVISLSEPEEGEEIRTGESMHLEMDLSDDVALAGYMVEVHNNFDHHGHKAPARAAEDSVVFYFKQSYEISGRNQHIHSHDVVIPANAKAGDYHLMVYCTDAAGNQSYVARNIVLSPDAEHHHHDDE